MTLTVKELIKKLEEIENKNLGVFVYINDEPIMIKDIDVLITDRIDIIIDD